MTQRTQYSSRLAIAAAIALVATLVWNASSSGEPFPEETLREIESAHEAYGNGWRANDRDAVLAALAEDVVLMPAGLAPIEGRAAAASFWWPDDGSTTSISAYAGTIEDIHGSGTVAVVRGRSSMTFTWEKDGESTVQTTRSMSLTVLEIGPDGRWRISMRMWSRTND